MSDRYQQFYDEAKNHLQNHQISRLSGKPGDKVGIWRLKQPGTNAYYMDVAVSGRMFAVSGDFVDLIFSPYSCITLERVAASNLGYLYDKLVEECAKKEWSPDSFMESVNDHIEDMLEKDREEIISTARELQEDEFRALAWMDEHRDLFDFEMAETCYDIPDRTWLSLAHIQRASKMILDFEESPCN